MIQIESYTSVNGLRFGSDELSILAVFGAPRERTVNRSLEKELHFPQFILRLNAQSDGLRELTLLPECNGTINGTSIAWTDELLDWMAMEDEELYQWVGFVISPKLGIMVTGFHDHAESHKSIHVFRKGDLDMFSDHLSPFPWRR